MSELNAKPPNPSAKRTMVGAGPPPPGPVRGGAAAPTVAAIAREDVNPNASTLPPPGKDAATRRTEVDTRPTAEDFQSNRGQHRGTQMQGIERLAEPGSEQGRVRLIPGKVIPGTRYRILRWLGEGGMGVVYEAEHINIARKVALKILRFDLSQEETMAKVFEDEARAASSVGSKHIVEIYDFGELEDGRLFFCMELIPGGDLVPETEDDWIEPPRLIGLLRQVCKGLSAAHKGGIVHRDIKPENIIVVNEDGRELVKLVDFGISAMVAAGSEEGGNIAGTPHYMAPEQITGTKFDGRLDIYALGCMAYELLVGYPPFLAEGIQELLQQQLYEAPKPLLECRPDREIPKELADVVMKCLEKDAAARWQDMDDLEAALCEAQIAAGIVTPWDDLPLPEGIDPERRERLFKGMPNPNVIVMPEGNRWLVPVIAAASALVIGVLLAWIFLGGKPTDEELDQIQALTIEAREAGSKTQWVYPPETEPDSPTAFQKVIELEHLEGSAADAGEERAVELRDEFHGTLSTLGNRYWGVPEARGFARDYYAMAYLFKPEDGEARERSGRTAGELADFRARASTGDFTEGELSAARWLDVFAEEDKGLAEQKANDLLAMEAEESKTGSKRSALASNRAVDAARGAGINVASAPPPPTAPVDADEGADDGEIIDDDAGAEAGEGAGEAGEEEPVIDSASTKKRNRRPKKSNSGSGDDETLGGSTRDPDKAAELAKQGMDALRAGRRSEAKTLFNQAISYDRRNAMALMGLSDINFDTGSNQKAVLYAERAVKAAPKNSGYRIKLGDAYYKVLRYRDALEQYEKAKSLGNSKADSRIAKAKSKIGG
ncbi:serine/threonine protein kinase [Plesiocystis pacifica SIR-1]|uniref:Serine/threonine protein kinase n=1 Tax=Plesiocystis pacifica SIR-1 TaxID=391625 RepID=A6G3X3_9BACT|nr:serine/threonine-protein kinase [Plesiocystis pacifica]EDM79510.1 serine/threonine protein kinase [Plesiocystis pacifica SIR-1]